MSKVISNEITYHIVVNQVFFDDDTELIIKTGYPEGQEHDLDITLEWVEGQAPEWAESLSKLDILKLTGEK
jgi:hypothetical protein